MKKHISLFVVLLAILFNVQLINAQSQETKQLTVDKIMRDAKWIGTSPSDIFWSPNGEKLYFNWNPDKKDEDELYAVSLKNHQPKKVDLEEASWARAQRRGSWNRDKTKLVFKKGNAVYVLDVHTDKRQKLIETTQSLRNPRFGMNGSVVVFRMGNNLFASHLRTGALAQLTNFKKGHQSSSKPSSPQEKFLEENALANSEVLRQRKKAREKNKATQKERKSKELKSIYLGGSNMNRLSLSPDGNFVVYRLVNYPNSAYTKVPNYVTESGYTEDIPGRPVVGVDQPQYETYIYNRKTQEIQKIKTDQISGIKDIPKFIKENYPDKYAEMKEEDNLRDVFMSQPIWNEKGNQAVMVIRSTDHKDRWIMRLDVENGDLKLLDRQHDDAWIGGPGIGYPQEVGTIGWLDNKTIYYQSEESGYSHLYLQKINSTKKKALTSGKYEIQEVQLSKDRQSFYITTNKTKPGERQFYHLNIKSKKQQRITPKDGGYQVVVSPDEKYLAELYSTNVHPWELYLQDNKSGAESQQITDKAESTAYKSYDWQSPKIVSFKNSDGLDVYAKIYQPEKQATSKPGVIFVHGAGYLQDVLHYWGYYFHEYMFMNLLAQNGYTVMEVDYRGSAGYGRDWRTAIYRHMGKNDLTDNVDAADYMVKNLNVNPANIGIWGGSYGGFMTLMAMFKTNTFKSGGALRSVTDWAHYNHDYTSDILNLPQNDSLAYQQSSPIYFADGLQGNLLMCHGMVDTNVHFQDIVRLTQKLIELGKEDWELAVYPVESHGFVEPSSWCDEYRRIFKLFEETLK